MLGFGRRGRADEAGGDSPPVLVPADAVRPGEDDRALVRALVRYVRVMRRDGPYAFGELHPDAVRAYAVDGYLASVEHGGHAAYLAELPQRSLLERCQEGLERVAPELAPQHGAVMAAQEAGRDAAMPETAGLDDAFRKAGGRTAADARLAGLIAGIEHLEVVHPDQWSGRLAELAAAHPEGESRRRDLRVAEIDAGLTAPVAAGVAIVLVRTLGRALPFTLRRRRAGGDSEAQWDVETVAETFRAAWYPDRLVVFRARGDGGYTGLGHLSHEKIALTCDWAERAHVALAAVLGLEEIGVADRLRTVVFDRRKTLKRSGAEAVSFQLSLDGTRDLALVVFPDVCAIVDPRSNERLAELDREALAAEAEAHAARMAVLLD